MYYSSLTTTFLSLSTNIPFLPGQEEQRLLDFHYSNLEFACGATLSEVRSHILLSTCRCRFNGVSHILFSLLTLLPHFLPLFSPCFLPSHLPSPFFLLHLPLSFFSRTHLHSRFLPSTGTTMIALHSFQGAMPSFLMATCPSSLSWPRDWRFI